VPPISAHWCTVLAGWDTKGLLSEGQELRSLQHASLSATMRPRRTFGPVGPQPLALPGHFCLRHLVCMTTMMRETAIDEDYTRLRLRNSLLEYLERHTEHHDEFVEAVKSGTAHSRDTMMRLAQLLEQRDTALEAHLDLLAGSGRRGGPLFD
jgi:hypothetical protein